jgi:hypothetical protein
MARDPRRHGVGQSKERSRPRRPVHRSPGTCREVFLTVAVAPSSVAIGVQPVWVAVAVVNRDPVANVGAVQVRRRRRQAVIRVGGVAILLPDRCRPLPANLSVHRFAGNAVAIGVHVSRLPVVLVVGACLLTGPPSGVHRGAILPDHQLDRSGGGRPRGCRRPGRRGRRRGGGGDRWQRLRLVLIFGWRRTGGQQQGGRNDQLSHRCMLTALMPAIKAA